MTMGGAHGESRIGSQRQLRGLRRVGASPSLALVIAALAASCFDGSSALGLPCRTDDDCGQGQACEEGFCGGPPATGSAESSGTTTAPMPTTTSADSSTGASSSGGEPECGNGVTEEGEECDPGQADSVDCDVDCTAVMCGDGHVNEPSGELCDDGNTSSVDECNEDCLPNFFWDDMEDAVRSQGIWTVDNPESMFGTDLYSLPGRTMWQLGLPGMPSVGVWHSGIYSEQAGVTRLTTEEIMFPPLPGPGMRYELRFRHTFRFDGNETLDDECPEPQFSDGAVVWVVDPMGVRQVGPPEGTGTPLGDLGACAMTAGDVPNPHFVLEPMPTIYGGESGEAFIDVVLPLGILPPTAQVAFDVGYDCANCWGMGPASMLPPAPGWTIDDVVVGVFRI